MIFIEIINSCGLEGFLKDKCGPRAKTFEHHCSSASYFNLGAPSFVWGAKWLRDLILSACDSVAPQLRGMECGRYGSGCNTILDAVSSDLQTCGTGEHNFRKKADILDHLLVSTHAAKNQKRHLLLLMFWKQTLSSLQNQRPKCLQPNYLP